jgi:hypothetical protein
MCCTFLRKAFSLKRILTCGKFKRSSTLGRSRGSYLSIQRMVRKSSSEYR